MIRLFVRNLPYSATEEELVTLFSEFGSVAEWYIVRDRETDQSRGFGFIAMEDSAASAAMNTLNETMFQNRRIFVSLSKPKEGRGNG